MVPSRAVRFPPQSAEKAAENKSAHLQQGLFPFPSPCKQHSCLLSSCPWPCCVLKKVHSGVSAFLFFLKRSELTVNTVLWDAQTQSMQRGNCNSQEPLFSHEVPTQKNNHCSNPKCQLVGSEHQHDQANCWVSHLPNKHMARNKIRHVLYAREYCRYVYRCFFFFFLPTAAT